MTKLKWNDVGERYFEAGVDRGVLFVSDEIGVPWNGLVGVNETPTGGEPRPFYIDGFKYQNLSSTEEFEATISAFSAPKEFAVCDGTKAFYPGLFVTQQPRVPFNFSYRTLLGNDTLGTDRGYKIHLVYNALAASSSRNNATTGSNVTPNLLSWNVSTSAPKIPGIRPTSHFVIDSTETDPLTLEYLEALIYGSETVFSRLPTVEELVEIFRDGPPPEEPPVEVEE